MTYSDEVATWGHPAWRNRSGRYARLVEHCVRRAWDDATARGDDDYDRNQSLGIAFGFASDLHGALNPEGQLLLEAEPPSREIENGEARARWDRVTGEVWAHRDPSDQLATWRAQFIAAEIREFPPGCNVDAVIDAVDDYVTMPFLAHPWIEWCLLDALIRQSVIGVADRIALYSLDAGRPGKQKKTWFERMFGSAASRARAERVRPMLQSYTAAFPPVQKTYAEMIGPGRTISPTRMKELMAVAEAHGMEWTPACHVVIGLAIKRNPAVWHCQPP